MIPGASVTNGLVAQSDLLGLAVIGIAIIALCVAQILDLHRRPRLSWKLASVIATLICAVAVALVLNRFAVLG